MVSRALTDSALFQIFAEEIKLCACAEKTWADVALSSRNERQFITRVCAHRRDKNWYGSERYSLSARVHKAVF